jgi:ABC-type uncharacterized transport system substrate-binding protein
MTVVSSQWSVISKSVFWFVLNAVLFALCVSAAAQQPKQIPRIGYLSGLSPSSESTRSEAIRLALRDLGYIEGQNIAIEYRYAEGKLDRHAELAAELARLKVAIILVTGGAGPIGAAMNATKTIPIVMGALGSILSRRVLLKALPVPAATLPALLSFPES